MSEINPIMHFDVNLFPSQADATRFIELLEKQKGHATNDPISLTQVVGGRFVVTYTRLVTVTAAEIKEAIGTPRIRRH